MWPVILWVFGLSVAAWIFYNAWDNLYLQSRIDGSARRRGESGGRNATPGERAIADWLKKHGVAFEFDRPVAHSLREPPLRPDFVLADRRLFIEYYGLKDAEASLRQRKEAVYRQKGWKVVVVQHADLDRLDEVLSPVLGSPKVAAGE